MSVPLAHIAGIPVEETALMLAPMWTGAAMMLAARARRALRRLRELRRDHRPRLGSSSR